MKNKRKVINSICIIIIIALSITSYFLYKKQKEKNEMNNLVTITNQFFDKYAKKGQASYEKLNMTATYTNNETVIVAGDKNEFMSMVYFEVDVDVNGENDDTSSYHKMRIKKGEDGNYKLVEEGNLVTADGLKLVDYSNKKNTKKDLSKIQKTWTQKKLKKH